MTDVTKEAIGDVLTSMMTSLQDELFATPESELDQYWHFRWDESTSDEWNTYKFHDALKMYGASCRRWEEHHGGTCCVVERVRDKYLLPKIKVFVSSLKERRQHSEAGMSNYEAWRSDYPDPEQACQACWRALEKQRAAVSAFETAHANTALARADQNLRTRVERAEVEAASVQETNAVLTQEIDRLRAALEAVKQWDIGHALDGLNTANGMRFTLPEELRVTIHAALKEQPLYQTIQGQVQT